MAVALQSLLLPVAIPEFVTPLSHHHHQHEKCFSHTYNEKCVAQDATFVHPLLRLCPVVVCSNLLRYGGFFFHGSLDCLWVGQVKITCQKIVWWVQAACVIYDHVIHLVAIGNTCGDIYKPHDVNRSRIVWVILKLTILPILFDHDNFTPVRQSILPQAHPGVIVKLTILLIPFDHSNFTIALLEHLTVTQE